MYDSKFVYILNSTYDLFEDFACLFLSHSFLADYIVEEFSILHEFHHQKEVFWGLDDLIQLNYVGMANQLQNMDFSRNSLDICHIHNTIFF